MELDPFCQEGLSNIQPEICKVANGDINRSVSRRGLGGKGISGGEEVVFSVKTTIRLN